MKMMMKVLVAAAVPAVALAGIPVEFPFDSTVIVPGCEVTAKLAAEELNDIVVKSAGRGFAVEKWNGGEVEKCGKRRIFVGRSAEAEAIVGTNVFCRLKPEESVVFVRGNDLFLLGGDPMGVLWVVYDFCEDSLGYRWYLDRTDGEKVVKTDVVRFNGVETRRRPKFTGFRISYNTPVKERAFSWRFRLRNRDTQAVGILCPEYRSLTDWRVPGHGFGFFLPPLERPAWLTFGKQKTADIQMNNFKTHPEWFTQMPDGTRNPDHQLCFSNPGCRKALTHGVMEWIRLFGKGYYQVGVNDSRSGLCWCENCRALQKKYNTTGGPLWDYLIELCNEVKAKYSDGVTITSLAYDGLHNTEKAPDNVKAFPDNFDVNIAYINCPDRTLTDIPDRKSPEGDVVNFYANTVKWAKMTRHASYWFYGTDSPFLVYRRMQKELQELREAGVESVGSCGTGGGYEFRDFTAYLYRRLAFDPWCDIRKELEAVCAFKYGKAAPLMLKYIDTLEETFEKFRTTEGKGGAVFNTGDAYGNVYFLKGREIADWRKLFDEAEALVKDSPFHAANVRQAKIGLDVYTVFFQKRVREEAPDCVFDAAAVKEAGISNAVEYAAKHLDAYQQKRNPIVRLLEKFDKQMTYYANLKDGSLPPEFRDYQQEFVTRILPFRSERPHKYCKWLTSVPDPDAPCGYAVRDTLSTNANLSAGIPMYIYDWSGAKQLMPTKIPLKNFRKGEYTTFKLGVTKLAPDCSFIITERWDSPLVLRYLNRCYNAACPNRKYEIWVTAKAEGPAFFPDEKGPNTLSIGAIYVCEVIGS